MIWPNISKIKDSLGGFWKGFVNNINVSNINITHEQHTTHYNKTLFCLKTV
jgi:hypothetical protein